MRKPFVACHNVRYCANLDSCMNETLAVSLKNLRYIKDWKPSKRHAEFPIGIRPIPNHQLLLFSDLPLVMIFFDHDNFCSGTSFENRNGYF